MESTEILRLIGNAADWMAGKLDEQDSRDKIWAN